MSVVSRQYGSGINISGEINQKSCIAKLSSILYTYSSLPLLGVSPHFSSFLNQRSVGRRKLIKWMLQQNKVRSTRLLEQKASKCSNWMKYDAQRSSLFHRVTFELVTILEHQLNWEWKWWVFSRRRIIISPSNMKKNMKDYSSIPIIEIFPPSLYSALYPSAHSLSPPPYFPCTAVYCMVCNLYVYIWLSKAVTPGVTPMNPLLSRVSLTLYVWWIS